jgi:hypothetical protein
MIKYTQKDVAIDFLMKVHDNLKIFVAEKKSDNVQIEIFNDVKIKSKFEYESYFLIIFKGNLNIHLVQIS